MWWTTANIFWRLNRSQRQRKTDIKIYEYGPALLLFNQNRYRRTAGRYRGVFPAPCPKTDYGIKAKTIGKMLDDQLTVEGLFSIVLMAEFDNGRYYFRTQTNGNDTVKSPIGMFDREIDNDLKTVDQKIREYWGFDMARFIDFRPDHSVPGRRETGEEFINAKYIKRCIWRCRFGTKFGLIR